MMSDVSWTMIQKLQTFYSGPIHVKISQTLGVREEYMQNAQVFTGICGPLLARYCHASSSWRTLQRTLFEEDEKWLGALPNWGMIVNGELYEVASAFGAPHRRERLFIVAYSMRKRRVEHTGFSQTIQPSRHDTLQRKESKQPSVSKPPHGSAHDGNYWTRHAPPSKLCRVDDGIAYRMDRIRSLGNAIVPQCAEWIGQQIWRSGLLSSK